MKELFCKANSVTLENFGKKIGHFPPLLPIKEIKKKQKKENNWFEIVIDIFKQPWFFGDLDKDDAFNIARKTNRNGDFLLRFSAIEGNWVLTFVRRKKKKKKKQKKIFITFFFFIFLIFFLHFFLLFNNFI